MAVCDSIARQATYERSNVLTSARSVPQGQFARTVPSWRAKQVLIIGFFHFPLASGLNFKKSARLNRVRISTFQLQES